MQPHHENDRTSQLCPHIKNAKCVFSLPDGCEIVRAIETSSETEVCSQMTTFLAVLVARGYVVDKISIFPSSNSAMARIKPLQIANMCGKLEHENSMFFFKPFILPLLVTVCAAGMFICVGYRLDNDHRCVSLGRVCVGMSTKEALLGEFDLAMGSKHKGLYVHDATDKRPHR